MSLGWDLEMLRFRDAIRWQVWPKFVPGVRPGSDHADMAVKLSWNNNVVTIPDPLDDPEIRPYAETCESASSRSRREECDFDAKCGNRILTPVQRATCAGRQHSLTLGKSRLDAELSPQVAILRSGARAQVDFDAPKVGRAIRREPLPLGMRPTDWRQEGRSKRGRRLSAQPTRVERAQPLQSQGPTTNGTQDIRDNRLLKTFTESNTRRNQGSRTLSHRSGENRSPEAPEKTIASVISKGLLGRVSGGLKNSPRNGPRVATDRGQALS